MNYNQRKRASNKGEGLGGGMRRGGSLRGVRRNDLGRLLSLVLSGPYCLVAEAHNLTPLYLGMSHSKATIFIHEALGDCYMNVMNSR